jgi:hypothetical protein
VQPRAEPDRAASSADAANAKRRLLTPVINRGAGFDGVRVGDLHLSAPKIHHIGQFLAEWLPTIRAERERAEARSSRQRCTPTWV